MRMHTSCRPHHQSGGGAWLHFHWLNCSQSDPRWCVTSVTSGAEAVSACDSLLPGDLTVIRLENRPNNAGSSDHTPSGESFHGFTTMEFTALPSEAAALVDATRSTSQDGHRVFMTDRLHHVRIFKPRAGASSALPAVWARHGTEILNLTGVAYVGEFYTFQVGIYTPEAAAVNLTLQFGDLKQVNVNGHASVDGTVASISAASFRCFNTGGVDEHGLAFTKIFSVNGGGSVGSMWVGVQIPTDASVGLYAASMVLNANGALPKTLALSLDIQPAPGGGSLPFAGDGDVYKMSRLRWLDSTVGIDDTVPHPFAPLVVVDGAAGLRVQLLNKVITIGADGLIKAATVTAHKVRRGITVEQTYEAISDGVTFELYSAGGTVVPLTVKKPAAVTSRSASDLQWSAILAADGVEVEVNGTVDFTSYVGMAVALSGTASLSDVRLRVRVPSDNARYVLPSTYRDPQISLALRPCVRACVRRKA